MNIFSAIKIYDKTAWQVKEVRNFNADEIAAVQSNYVKTSDYGMSVCFCMIGGQKAYIPVGRDSHVEEGQSINLHTAKLVTLCKEGEADIFRVEI